MSGEADSRNGVDETGRRAHMYAHVHVLLNSQLVHCLAVARGPSSGTPADTRLIIEGKIAEMGQQPQKYKSS